MIERESGRNNSLVVPVSVCTLFVMSLGLLTGWLAIVGVDRPIVIMTAFEDPAFWMSAGFPLLFICSEHVWLY